MAGSAVTAAPVTLTPVAPVAEHPREWRRVTDPKELELMLAGLEDWWASGRPTPRPGLSPASQPHLVTPPVVPASGPSAAVVIPAAVALSSSSRSVVPSSRSA